MHHSGRRRPPEARHRVIRGPLVGSRDGVQGWARHGRCELSPTQRHRLVVALGGVNLGLVVLAFAVGTVFPPQQDLHRIGPHRVHAAGTRRR